MAKYSLFNALAARSPETTAEELFGEKIKNKKTQPTHTKHNKTQSVSFPMKNAP